MTNETMSENQSKSCRYFKSNYGKGSLNYEPIKLQLNNFGPFLNETIDFSQIENNQLFLISGKRLW